MKYEQVKLDSFNIVGVAVRTTNKNGNSQQDIGQLWAYFMQNEVRELIPNRISDDIYCTYTDYESDFTGEYTAILGCKVSSIDNLPQGLMSKKIPDCDYRLYCSEGQLPECLGKTWMHIWQSPDIDRRYAADFDIYGIESQNPDDARVFTYLSVK